MIQGVAYYDEPNGLATFTAQKDGVTTTTFTYTAATQIISAPALAAATTFDRPGYLKLALMLHDWLTSHERIYGKPIYGPLPDHKIETKLQRAEPKAVVVTLDIEGVRLIDVDYVIGSGLLTLKPRPAFALGPTAFRLWLGVHTDLISELVPAV